MKSDFEFRIDTVTNDSINLTGRFNGSTLRLKKATQQDRAVWDSKQVKNGMRALPNFFKFLQYWKRLNYGGSQYEFLFDTTGKSVTVSYLSNGQAQSVTRGYYYWANGIGLTDPVVNGSQTITGFSIGTFNAGTQVLNVTVNGTAATITGNGAPINPTSNTFESFWQKGVDNNSYWVSPNGFHINGVDDAYGLSALKTDSSEFYYLIYWPSVVNGQYDAFVPFFYNPAKNDLEFYYGTSPQVTASTSGRILFREQYLLGTANWPTTGAAASTRTQFYQAGGYYFVKTSENSYDMVSVADAKTWLTWIWIF